MKRYQIDTSPVLPEERFIVREDPCGKWVKYEDVRNRKDATIQRIANVVHFCANDPLSQSITISEIRMLTLPWIMESNTEGQE